LNFTITGVSNHQLGKEDPSMALTYRNKSIAEQNSLDLSWNLLMSDSFTNLRRCIFETEIELKRFRQIIVNAVLATDIFDPDLNLLRKKRWEKAFSTTCSSTTTDEVPEHEINNLRATIVLEHLIQASDVAHTMQHWHVYRKWNKNLFNEMLLAYRTGRMDIDPATFWYHGELKFFDNYIIPLSKKLQECQVFGVCSDEYLNYAIQNRAEWEDRGQEMLADMIAEFDHSLPPNEE
jgi:3'5'-cyclic nucleotide phosphodiesterase